MTENPSHLAEICPPERASTAEAVPARRGGWLRALLLRLVVPALVIGAGGGAAAWLITTKPNTKRRQPERAAALVEVTSVRRSTERVVVTVMGTAMPAQQITLQARVGGRVMDISPNLAPGGRFAAGETILQIDRRDYESVVVQRQGDVAQADLNHKVELGRQEIAKREWELHEQTGKASALDLELALRKPYLLQAQAAVAAAAAASDKAALDLERTTLRAPFNAVVLSEQVDLGSELTSLTSVATLAGTDEYWVQASVPVDQLRWLRFPGRVGERGSPARVRVNAEPGAVRTGHVARLLGALETEGRMAQILVAVEDPLGLKAKDSSVQPLLLGSYVQVEIDGRELDSVIPLSRDLVRDGDRVWVMNADGKLEIRAIQTAFRSRDRVLVAQGLQEGERLVTTDLPAPVEGMPLRTETSASPPALAADAAQRLDKPREATP